MCDVKYKLQRKYQLYVFLKCDSNELKCQ
uniref:Uncharacterized protein n=1 Tax=Arundo donax TaxID=35708 RepID=A0A0A8YHC6_ARUDO